MTARVRIATRKSALALWQARHVADRLESGCPGLTVEMLPLTTRGDRLLDTPLARIGGKGLFLKELERALLESEADIAVHSMKDVPAHMTPGLTIAAVLKRANPSDAWLAREGLGIDELPPGSTVGTSSLRRQCQLLARRPDLKVTSLRGNVNTRLEKLDRGEYDAIILATAGLDRLGESLRITSELPAPDWLPAPAQGVIGVQCRSGDEATGAMVARLNHPQTAKLTQAERSLSRRLGGSCQLPLAAFARLVRDEMIALDAMVGSSDGHTLLRSQSEETDDPEAAAGSVAEQLLAKGADAIIRAELELASSVQTWSPVSFSHVLITRPQADAERLAGLLASIGIDSIVQPAQEFNARTLGASELLELEHLGPPLLVIFTSPRAVDYGLPQLPPSLAGAARFAAIGPATARAVTAAGKKVDIQPDETYTSESLLEALAGQPGGAGGTALVLCAPGGRELLVQRLGQLGWIARPTWVYERRAADIQPQSLEAISQAERLLTVFTSAQAMDTLSRRLPPSSWYAICRGEWLVISDRLKRLARAFGPSKIHVAGGPQNADLANTIRSLN